MTDSTLSQALKEAYASAPADAIVYHTLELRHPAFTTPIRVVRDNADLEAWLEAGAPENPGQKVTFIGYAFDLTRPEVNIQGMPQCAIEIDNVSREIVASIEAAMAYGEPITVTYREYLSDDLSAPQNDPPITLTILAVTATVFRLRATAGFPNLAGKQFPVDEYNAQRFPGLVLS